MINKKPISAGGPWVTVAQASLRSQRSARKADPFHRTRCAGFTLIELLVVILIILIISAVALPTVIPAISHRQVSEGARILQGALVGARDVAIHNNAPSGIRLLPDPTFNGINPSTNLLDRTLPLACNRIVPLQPAPEYSEGLASIYFVNANNINNVPASQTLLSNLAYPGPVSGGFYSSTTVLMVEESVINMTTFLPNAPTSWFWNIRVGDQIQFNNAGPWYTVVGPMAVTPSTGGNGNPEMFVNVGLPGANSNVWSRTIVTPNGNVTVNPEFLLLVDGQDDNNNGWVDEGWDGLNNNSNSNGADDLSEWIETEAWHGAIIGKLLQNPVNGLPDLPYTIQRRPAPSPNAREVSLPTQVVIDLTTWGYPFPTTAYPNLTASRERSRLPVNPFTGYVDILVYPNGSVVPSTIYSSPSSFPMGGAFLHFWVAERSDVYAPTANTVSTSTPPGAPYLPLPQGLYPGLFSGIELKGEFRLVTLFSRTGQVSTIDEMQFDPSLSTDIANGQYIQSYPFLQAQQGVRGGP